MIELHNVSAGYHGRAVLQGVDLAFAPGQVLALIGPNGSGKSTLLRAALGLVPCLGGEVLYDGVPLRRLSARQVAQKAAFLSQSRAVPNLSAQRMVLHGRFPHLSYPRHYREEDRRIVRQALAAVDAADLAARPVTELSGGQRQKVYLAMAIAQQTPSILMDEPTTFLDIAHQLGVMELSRRLEGMPRNTSTNAAGVVITRLPVHKYVPLATNDGVPVTQYTMVTLEELGLL